MTGTSARVATPLSDTQQLTRKTGSLVSRKVWLPKLLYSALPYFYIVSGIAAFLGTLYISEWFWVLPHYILFSAICIHLGIKVYRLRKNAAARANT